MQEKISIVCLSHAPQLNLQPGLCPDGELNRRPFALPDHTQPTEPYQPGPFTDIFLLNKVREEAEECVSRSLLQLHLTGMNSGSKLRQWEVALGLPVLKKQLKKYFPLSFSSMIIWALLGRSHGNFTRVNFLNKI